MFSVGEEVVVITADSGRGDTSSIDIVVLAFRERLRKKAALDLASDFDFFTQPFVRTQLLDQHMSM